MESNFRVYLAGPIEDIDKEEAVMWREHLELKLRILGFEGTCISPMRGKDPELPSNLNDKEIVLRDIKDIQGSDVVIACLPEEIKVVGTLMELVYATLLEKPTYVFAGDESLQFHPWITYHSTRIFLSIDELVQHVMDEIPFFTT